MKFHGIASLFRFFRNWTGNTGRDAGSYEADAMQVHRHAAINVPVAQGMQIAQSSNNILANCWGDVKVNNSVSTGNVISSRTAERTRPENVTVPVALYLGNHV